MKNQGFTLVEMLLVLAIIGILIAILVPSVIGITREAKEKQVQSDLRMIQAALGQYYLKNASFPPDGDDSWVDLLLDLRPRIIEKRPYDPFDPDSLYGYAYYAPLDVGDIPTYVVWSKGFSGSETAVVVDHDWVRHTVDCIFVTNATKLTTP